MTDNKQYIQALMNQRHRIKSQWLMAVYVVMHPKRRQALNRIPEVEHTHTANITEIDGMIIIESKDVSTDEPLIVAK